MAMLNQQMGVGMNRMQSAMMPFRQKQTARKPMQQKQTMLAPTSPVAPMTGGTGAALPPVAPATGMTNMQTQMQPSVTAPKPGTMYLGQGSGVIPPQVLQMLKQGYAYNSPEVLALMKQLGVGTAG